jgi:hypothetical protein
VNVLVGLDGSKEREEVTAKEAHNEAKDDWCEFLRMIRLQCNPDFKQFRVGLHDKWKQKYH